MLLMILGACVRTPSTVSSPGKNSYVSTYSVRSCSYGSSSQLWCFEPVFMNFLVLQSPFWKGTLRAACNIYEDGTAGIYALAKWLFLFSVSSHEPRHSCYIFDHPWLLRWWWFWRTDIFPQWHKQPQPISGLVLLCSHLQYVAFLASEFPLLLHLAWLFGRLSHNTSPPAAKLL